jgi:hypothetical protein
LRIRDVNTESAVLFVDVFKGRARWVPFHRSLARELDRYLEARATFAPAGPDTRFFVGINEMTLPVNTASGTLRGLFRLADMKPAKGRIGPRPYDLRQRADSPIMPTSPKRSLLPAVWRGVLRLADGCSATIKLPGRVDSSVLLPSADRCLMKDVTHPGERGGWRIEEATECGNQT